MDLNHLDHIYFINSNEVEAENYIRRYFEDQFISHPGTEVSLLKEKDKNNFLVIFLQGIKDELFLFCYTSLFESEAEHQGWCCLDDDTRTRVYLKGEFSDDYTVGYTERGDIMHFQYDRSFSFFEGLGYKPSNFDLSLFDEINRISFRPQRSQLELSKNKGCLTGLIALLKGPSQ